MNKRSTTTITPTMKSAHPNGAGSASKITPCLWFDDQAEDAAQFYVSLFENSSIRNVSRYGESGAKASGRPKGAVMTVTFELDGQEFMGLNGGPVFTFSPAVSFVVNCETQEEIDELWRKLSADPAAEQCGWLKDKYGVSWQIVPKALGRMMADAKAGNPERVMEALLKMRKLDLAALKASYRKR